MLSIALLVMFAARVAYERRHMTWSLTWGLWWLTALQAQVLFWVSYSLYPGMRQSSMVGMIWLMALASQHVLLAALLTPRVPVGQAIDLKALHERHGDRYMIAHAALLLLMSGLPAFSAFVREREVSGLPMVQAVAMAAITLSAVIWKPRWLQIAAPFAQLGSQAATFYYLLSVLAG